VDFQDAAGKAQVSGLRLAYSTISARSSTTIIRDFSPEADGPDQIRPMRTASSCSHRESQNASLFRPVRNLLAIARSAVGYDSVDVDRLAPMRNVVLTIATGAVDRSVRRSRP